MLVQGRRGPDDALIDGQLVRVAVEAGTPEEKVMVPQAALLADQALAAVGAKAPSTTSPTQDAFPSINEPF